MELNAFVGIVILQQALLAMSLYVPLMGGQLSLASPAFFAIGGYLAAIVSTSLGSNAELYPLSYFLGECLAAALLCFGLASVTGLFILRLKGIYLALATVAMVEVIRILCLNLHITGGAIGIFGIPQIFADQAHYVWFFLPLFLLVLIAVLVLEKSRLGRALRAIREDEYAAAAMGISLAPCKTLAFAIGAAIAGITGVGSAHLLNTWNARQGTFDAAINTLAYVMIGGPWTVWGASAGAAFLAALPELLRPLADFRLIVNGSLILLACLFLPKGLIQERWFRRKYKGPKLPPSPDQKLEYAPPKVACKAQQFLSLQELSVQFGGLRAVDSLSFEVKQGEIFGLIGPNGAGKTTVFNMLSGFVSPSSGRIVWRDQDIQSLAIPKRVHLGIARTFQNLRLLRQQTVLDNVLAAVHRHLPATQVGASASFTYEALSYIRLCGLEDKLDQLAGTLSYGDQRRLELARALMLRPQLLLLDEPVAGMNPQEKLEMKQLMRRLRDHLGITLLIIEHHVPLILDLCDRIAVLNFGKLIALEHAANIPSHPAVQEAYLGHKERTRD